MHVTNDPDIGTQAASTYMEFTTVAADFDQAGIWTVCGVYTDATKILHGSTVSFTVGATC